MQTLDDKLAILYALGGLIIYCRDEGHPHDELRKLQRNFNRRYLALRDHNVKLPVWAADLFAELVLNP